MRFDLLGIEIIGPIVAFVTHVAFVMSVTHNWMTRISDRIFDSKESITWTFIGNADLWWKHQECVTVEDAGIRHALNLF